MILSVQVLSVSVQENLVRLVRNSHVFMFMAKLYFRGRWKTICKFLRCFVAEDNGTQIAYMYGNTKFNPPKTSLTKRCKV